MKLEATIVSFWGYFHCVIWAISRAIRYYGHLFKLLVNFITDSCMQRKHKVEILGTDFYGSPTPLDLDRRLLF